MAQVSIKDYKNWIDERAKDIVFNLFVEPFDRSPRCPICSCELYDSFEEKWERHKDWAYIIALDDYKDAVASGSY